MRGRLKTEMIDLNFFVIIHVHSVNTDPFYPNKIVKFLKKSGSPVRDGKMLVIHMVCICNFGKNF